MKIVLLLGLAAGMTEAHRHHRHQHHKHHKPHHHGLLQAEAMVIDKKTLHPDMHWRLKWPQGIDDGTNDDIVLNDDEKEEEADKPLKYDDKMRQWNPGTWPVNHSWDKDWEKASFHNMIDDGTDDNEVVDLQNEEENI